MNVNDKAKTQLVTLILTDKFRPQLELELVNPQYFFHGSRSVGEVVCSLIESQK